MSPNQQKNEDTKEVEETGTKAEGEDDIPQSHQAQLNVFGTGLLFLEDVIQPAIVIKRIRGFHGRLKRHNELRFDGRRHTSQRKGGRSNDVS